VALWDRPDGSARAGSRHVAGPEGSEAPLTLRRIMVFDARMVYGVDGSIRVGDQ
jgi:hypothetical protein